MAESLSEDLSVEEIVGADAVAAFRAALTDADRAAIGDPDDLLVGEPAAVIGLYLVRRADRMLAWVPRLRRTVPLPIRLGEKILWRARLPGVLILSAAQRLIDDPVACRYLISWLVSQRPSLAVIFADLMSDTPLRQALTEQAGRGIWLANDVPAKHLFHRFGESYEAFFDSRKSKYKNQIRKKIKVFEERCGGDFRLAEYRAVDEVPVFLEAAERINKRTYQFNLFGEEVKRDAESERRFGELARLGLFRSFALWHGQTPLCFVLGTQGVDGVYSHIKTGFDPAWRDSAPGINTNILLLQRLYAQDRPRILDFGSGDADYKRLFANEDRMSSSPVLIPKTLRNGLIFGANRLASRGTDAAVGLLERWGLKERVKRFLRQRASHSADA